MAYIKPVIKKTKASLFSFDDDFDLGETVNYKRYIGRYEFKNQKLDLDSLELPDSAHFCD